MGMQAFVNKVSVDKGFLLLKLVEEICNIQTSVGLAPGISGRSGI